MDSSHGHVTPKTINMVFVAKQVELIRKSKDWLAQFQDNVAEYNPLRNLLNLHLHNPIWLLLQSTSIDHRPGQY